MFCTKAARHTHWSILYDYFSSCQAQPKFNFSWLSLAYFHFLQDMLSKNCWSTPRSLKNKIERQPYWKIISLLNSINTLHFLAILPIIHIHRVLWGVETFSCFNAVESRYSENKIDTRDVFAVPSFL